MTMREESNEILSIIVDLFRRFNPNLRYIQTLWILGIIDKEDRYYEEPDDTLTRILPNVKRFLITIESQNKMESNRLKKLYVDTQITYLKMKLNERK